MSVGMFIGCFILASLGELLDIQIPFRGQAWDDILSI